MLPRDNTFGRHADCLPRETAARDHDTGLVIVHFEQASTGNPVRTLCCRMILRPAAGSFAQQHGISDALHRFPGLELTRNRSTGWLPFQFQCGGRASWFRAGYLLQPPISVRPLGEAFVQSFWCPILLWQFFAHELLYLYTTSKSTISNLRSFDRHFQSRPSNGPRLTSPG